MRSSLLPLIVAFLFAIALGPPAEARGPGSFSVTGIEGSNSARYSGSASLIQLGPDTWRINWRIGRTSWNGYSIGDGKFIAMNFSGNGQAGVMLLIAREDGSGYDAVWAYNGERNVGGRESWTRQ